MKVRKGVVVVVWKLVNNAPRFAVLKRDLNWEGWELVKGGLEGEENYKKTAEREVKEETGIKKIIDLENFEREERWSYKRDGNKIESRYKVFTAQVPEDAKVDVSKNPHGEHSKGFFLNPRDSKDILTHEGNKKLIEKAMEILKEEKEEET